MVLSHLRLYSYTGRFRLQTDNTSLKWLHQVARRFETSVLSLHIEQRSYEVMQMMT